MSCCTPVSVELPSRPRTSGKIQTVALVGPPNSGKSTLFNRLTGLRQKVANYPGVTVEQRIGKLSGIGRSDLLLIDLPGIYSLSSYTEDARVAVDVLHGAMPGTPAPDAILLVLDSMHLSRQLMLAGPVLELGLPTLILLNMSDVMEARNGEVDSLALAQELGAPVAKISATRGTGLDAVRNFLARKNAEVQRPLQLPIMGNAASYRQWATGVSTRTKYKAPLSSETTRKLDRVCWIRIWGPLLFLAVVVTLFQAVFTLGQPLERWISDDSGWSWRSSRCAAAAGLDRVVADRGRLEGRFGNPSVSAANTAALSVHWGAGGFRLPGSRCADRRPRNASNRVEWKGFYPVTVRLRLRRSSDHVDSDDREQAGPDCDHPGHARL